MRQESIVERKNQLRVLICDDSAFLRVTLRKIIESDHDLRVVDIARNGAEAIEKAVRLRPDVITMDIHMPVVDGLTALKDITRLKVAPVIILASATSGDAGAAVDAMEMGAFDFITKPDVVDSLESRATAIIQKIKQAAASNFFRKLEEQEVKEDEERDIRAIDSPLAKTSENIQEVPIPSQRRPGYKSVVLGLSTGGPKSILHVLPLLPAKLKAPVFVIQHMPPAFLTTFTERLNKKTAMPCIETEAGMTVEQGKIYIAKGGYHLKLRQKASGGIIIRQTKDPHHLFMPSVDIAMHSVCDIFGSDTIGVLMTGMGRDGAEAMERIYKSGGMTIAESEDTAIVFGMPKEAIKRGAARRIVPRQHIADAIIQAVSGTKK